MQRGKSKKVVLLGKTELTMTSGRNISSSDYLPSTIEILKTSEWPSRTHFNNLNQVYPTSVILNYYHWGKIKFIHYQFSEVANQEVAQLVWLNTSFSPMLHKGQFYREFPDKSDEVWNSPGLTKSNPENFTSPPAYMWYRNDPKFSNL